MLNELMLLLYMFKVKLILNIYLCPASYKVHVCFWVSCEDLLNNLLSLSSETQAYILIYIIKYINNKRNQD